MSQNQNEQLLIKAINDYIDNGTSTNDMQAIAHLLNSQPAITPKLRICFYNLLSDLDHTRIKKTLDLLEYLTIFSSPKTLQIINDDKFMENIAQAPMEYYLQEPAMNLLKLWTDEFAESKDEIQIVCSVIENLEPMGFSLPASYESPYKNTAANEAVIIDIKDNQPEEAMEDTEATTLAPKIKLLLDKSAEVVENITRFLENPATENIPPEDRKKKFNLLLAQNYEITSEMTVLKMAEYGWAAKEKVDKAVETLQNSRVKIHEKLDQLYSPNKASQQPQNNDEPYKIVVSETGNNSTAETSQSKIMEIDELLNYKVHQCESGQVCNHAPAHSRRFPDHSPCAIELHCPYYHNTIDRRRSVYDDNYRSMYGPSMCDEKDLCFMHDACSLSHNYFESAYHPMNYKKKKCKFPSICKNGKYCPYYHTQEEKEAWEAVATQYFDAISEGNSRNFLGDDNQDTQEIPTFKNQDSTETLNSNMVEEPQDNPQGGYTEMQDSNGYEVKHHQTDTVYGRSNFSRQHARLYNNPQRIGFQKYQSREEEETVVPTGTLHSKLVIRKKYDEPSMLSSFFQKSAIFSGIPFVSSECVEAVKEVKSQVKEGVQEEEDPWKDTQN